MKNLLKLLITTYLIPFAYLGMLLDYKRHSVLGYFVMIIIPVVVIILNKDNKSIVNLLVGNIISLLSSFIFFKYSNNNWGYFFKPFTPKQFLLLICALNVLPQIIALIVIKKRK